MKNYLLPAILGVSLLLISGVYAQNTLTTPRVSHPLDGRIYHMYDENSSPMKQAWPSAPVLAPAEVE